MNKTITNWLEKRHSVLWEEFQDKEFEREQAVNILTGEKIKDDEKSVNMILSELRRADLLEVKLNPDDARRSIYKLKKIEGVNEILAKNNLTRSDIDALLKKAADLIRTRVDYKFILILLFLKRISDKWKLEFDKTYKEALEDGFSEEEAREEAKNPAYHDFDFPEEFLWENIRKETSALPEKFSKSLKILSEKNPELKDILGDVDFIQFTSNRENAEILRQLVEIFSAKKLTHVSADMLGDAYEWILGYFAPQRAKEGEVYTPREVIKLLVEILDPRPGESVYDPASASNGMLIISYKHVENLGGRNEADKLFLYGQEVNPKTLALGKMNLYIHDIKNAHIMQGDTLLYPKFKKGDKTEQFDIVIANPPWNQDGYEENVLKKGEFYKQRFRYGFTSKQSADWAWIQHMLASAKDDRGKVGIVIDNGCLFRGGKEKTIRAKLLDVKNDLIECVILLPEKLFYNTGAPGAIMILNKNKSAKRKNKVLFINASNEFEKHPEVRKLNILDDKNIRNITEIYNDFKEIEGVSRRVSLDEIKENDYNLNVSLYAFPMEEIEEIDINKEWEDLKEAEKGIQEIENKIEVFLKEIG